MTTHYIGLDVHCQFTEYAVVTSSGRVTKRGHCPTTIPELVTVIEAVKRPRQVAFEEGPMAEWLYRGLLPHADEVVACEPRRNRWIAKDSEKDDPLDAAKVAQLQRGAEPGGDIVGDVEKWRAVPAAVGWPEQSRRCGKQVVCKSWQLGRTAEFLRKV